MRHPGEHRFSSALLAVLVHILFFGLLIVGVRWQSERPAPVSAELWESLPPPQPIKKPEPEVKPPPPEPKPEPQPEPKPEPKPEAKPEPKPEPVDPEILLKEQERKKKLEEEKRKQEELMKQEELKKKEEAEKKQKLEDEKKLKQAEQKRRQEEERARERALKEQLEKEAADRRREQERHAAALKAQQTREAAGRDKAIADQIARIREKIRRNVILPPDMAGNPQAEFQVVLLPSGEVLSVKLSKSSGHAAYDSAVERAIYKSQPLPLPEDRGLFPEFRDLALTFRPRE